VDIVNPICVEWFLKFTKGKEEGYKVVVAVILVTRTVVIVVNLAINRYKVWPLFLRHVGGV
jgi:hypothetical protein